MNKTGKMIILTSVVLACIVAIFFTIKGAVNNPEYPEKTEIQQNQYINANTLEVETKEVKVNIEDKTKPMIRFNYVIFIKLECIILGFAVVYVFMSDFCDKKNEVIFENKAMIFTYIILSLVVLEATSSALLILTKSMMF